MNNVVIRDEISFLYHAVSMCKDLRSGHDGAWQIAPFQSSIPFTHDCIENLNGLRDSIHKLFPELIRHGEDRAHRAFVNLKDSVTKPSYSNRIANFRDSHINQFETMLDISKREAASGGLVFSVFSPEDLIERQRPGYVPCLVAGSFLLHESEIQLNAFFRSQSVLEFGLFDLIFLRKFQTQFVEQFNLKKGRGKSVTPGHLNLHFARVLIQRRLARKGNRSFIRRDSVVEKWLKVVEEFMMSMRY
jgi:hypothetical protein